MRNRSLLHLWVLTAVLVCACNDVAGPPGNQPPDSIIIRTVSFSATTSVAGIPAEVVTTVTATNTVTDSTTLEIRGGGCRVRLRAFRYPDRSGRPEWDHDRWSPNCTHPAFRIELGIGENVQFTKSIPVASILGDSLPEGRYYFTARLTKSNQAFEMTSGSAVLRR